MASPSRSHSIRLVGAGAMLALGAVVLWTIRDPVAARVLMLVGAALIAWLSELVPPYVTTLSLLAGIPLLLGATDPAYRLGPVLGWAADPVLALFFGGFALGAATSRHALDEVLASGLLELSHHRRQRLLVLVIAATALLAMWMSTIAAAAMMFAALRPHLRRGEHEESFRVALLLAVAMGANLGGMASPIGTGPNGIAIAQLERWTRISFAQWMLLTLPVTVALLAFAAVLIVRVQRVRGTFQPMRSNAVRLQGRQRALIVVFALSVGAWLTEPLHGISSPVIALGLAAVLFGGGWLGQDDLRRIDWSTLLLIAGGIVLGRLIEHSGVLHATVLGLPWDRFPMPLRVTGLVFAAALMGALMSNTASAVMLIPLASAIVPMHSIAILIAVGTSLGVPFTISTPQNAMARGHGLQPHALLRIGAPLMLFGSLLLGLTGPAFLRWVGLP